MAVGPLHNTVEPLRKLAAAHVFADWGDQALLERFLAQRDETAFAALVGRHQRLVAGVCRHLLREHDAEDAFQAAFVVLAMKGRSIRKGQALASWLHGVAYRCAMQIKRQQARRRRHEQAAARSVAVDPAEAINLRELWAMLEAEIELLPEKHRAPFVLCCLEGKSQEEAGRQLGWKIGTVSGRLARARQELQDRLARKGIALAAVLGAAAVAKSEVSAAAVSAAVRGGGAVLSGTKAGVVSPQVLTIVKGVTQAMFFSKIKNVMAILLLVGLLTGAGLSGALLQDRPEPKKEADKPPKNVAAVVEAKNEPLPNKELRYDGKPFEYWRDFATNELKAERRIDAVRAMGAFGVRGYAQEGTEVIVRLIKEYHESDMVSNGQWYSEPGKFAGTPDQRVILEASLAISKIGPAAVPVLLKNLDAASVRYFATGAFAAGMVRLPASQVPTVLGLIRDGEPEVRAAAIVILLERNLNDEKWRDLLNAAKSEDTGKLVQSLSRAVEAPSTRYYNSTPAADWAALLLGRLEGAARPAGPALVAAALKGNRPAFVAIRKIKPDAKMVVALASAALKKELNRPAIELLAEMGADAKSAVPVLLAALKSPPPKERNFNQAFQGWVSDQYAILTALAKIGPDRKDVAAPLAAMMGDKAQDLRLASAAFALLRKTETDLEPMVPALASYLELMCTLTGQYAIGNPLNEAQITIDPAAEAAEVVRILEKLGPKSEKAMPALLKCFAVSPTRNKLAVVKTWTAMGSSARDALPVLYQCLANSPKGGAGRGSESSAESMQELRNAAKEAIKAINK